MNLYSVHVDRDSLDGVAEEGGPPVTGKITRLVYRYVANTLEEVWHWHQDVLMTGHDNIVAVIQDAEGVSVLPPTPGDERG